MNQDRAFEQAEMAWSALDEKLGASQVCVLSSWPGAPVTINDDLYQQICVTRKGALELADEIDMAISAEKSTKHISIHGDRAKLFVAGIYQGYTIGNVAKLAMQIRVAVRDYELTQFESGGLNV